MMKRLSFLLIALLFALTPAVRGADSADVTMAAAPASAVPYFDAATVDLKALLPDPPAIGSPETQKEIDLILEKQKTRTPEEVARIKNEARLNVWLFENTLGPWFTKKGVPVTAAFLDRVDATEHPIVDSAKKYWNRPRPPLQDKRVHPPIDLPKNTSYPSGHSSFGYLNALILAELAPDLKDAVVARGVQIGDDRVIGGVHFPSDVEAGHMLANAIFAKLMANADFQADLAKAKAEIAAVRGSAGGGKP